MDGDTALIGSRNRGSAYVFTRSGGEWTEQAKLTASDSQVWNYFGLSVALHGDTALIGARGDDGNGIPRGSVYIFSLNAATVVTIDIKPGSETNGTYLSGCIPVCSIRGAP